jgi:hypothetical protein
VSSIAAEGQLIFHSPTKYVTDLLPVHHLSVTENRHVLPARAGALLIYVLQSTTVVLISSQKPEREPLHPRHQHTYMMHSQAHRFLRLVPTGKKRRIPLQMLQIAMGVLDRLLALPRWDESGTLEVPHPIMIAVISGISQPRL